MDNGGAAGPAFTARCLLRAAKWASLATSSAEQPFVSLVTPAVAPDGAILLLLSALAEHARHLAAAPRCAIMVTGKPENLNWQTAPRVTVTGEARVVADAQARRFWLGRHPYARLYVDFSDFSLWRLVPEQALFVAGFGQAARLDGAALLPPAAAVQSVEAAAASLIALCNATHGAALNRIAHAGGAQGDWRMLGIDTDGFDLVQDETVLRLAFAAPVADGAAAQAAMLRHAQAAPRRLW